MRRSLLLLVVVLAACGSGRKASPPVAQVRAADIPAAVHAVEEARGGPQQYTEINANPDGVTLFVASGPTDEVSYFFYDGTLDPAGAPTARQGATFALDGVPLDVGAQLVQRLEAEFDGAVVTRLALIAPADQGLGWAVTHRSAKGGLVNSFYSPKGDVKAVAPAG